MNILLFVTTMLMVMTIMTYARVETFRASQGFQILFQNYMEQTERGYLNEKSKTLYDTIHFAKEGPANPKTSPIKASPRVTIAYLVNKKAREGKSEVFQAYNVMLKKLMKALYSDQPFFREMLAKNPEFMDQILSAVEKASDALPEDRQIKKAEELANLDLGDSELNEVFYKMLLGAPLFVSNNNPQVDAQMPQLILPQEKEVQVDEEPEQEIQNIDKIEAEEHKSSQGYTSLLDNITTAKVPQIRVFLAPRNVLRAIFNDASLVSEIMKTRKELHRELINDKEAKAADLKTIFEGQFAGRQDPEIDPKILDFSVSKTDPGKYDKN